MNDPLNKLKESANEVRLSRSAFTRIRAELVAHILAAPLTVPSPYARFLRMPVLKPVAAIVLFALVVTGGATTYAAEKALPGDSLYPVKVKVIEPVRSLFAVTPEAKAKWQASIAAERLSEMAELAAREKLTPEESTQGNKRFKESLEAAEKSISDLSENDLEAAVRIKESLRDALHKHQETLLEAAAATSTSAEEARTTEEQVKIELKSKLHLDSGNTDLDTESGPRTQDGIPGTETRLRNEIQLGN